MRLTSCMFLIVFLLFLTSFVKASIPVGIPTDAQWLAAKNQAIAFVNQLTLPEIVSIGTGVNWYQGTCVGNTPNISRVNYAGLCLQDSPTGVRFVSNASAFPAAINAASTWNRSLIYERGVAMGAEFRGKGVNIALTPMMNLGRVAAGGRNWEGFGGDPYLQGVGASESILGIQSQGVIACAKHYIGNEQEHFRETISSDIGERTLRELYAWPFYKSVQAGVGSVMCSYNKVNGTWACENNHTQNQLLKEEFGFRGFLMSDWGATHTTVFSVNSGLDMTMPGGITFDSPISAFGPALVQAVNNLNVTVDRATDMAVRILTSFFLFGQDKDFPAVNFDFRNSAIGTNVNVQSDHYKLIRKIGADSNVLLKNSNNVLPLTTIKASAMYNFAVIGSDAGAGNGPNSCSDHGCDSGTLAQGWGSGTSNFPYLVTPLDAITKRATVNSQSVVSSIDSDWNTAKAAEVAASADIAIVCVKANSGEAYITVDNNQGDRNNLSLWDNGDALIQAVANVNSKTVVVLHVVGPVLMPWIDHPNVTAVVLAGLPGQESGNSLADVLFGDVNPSGKLAYTIAKNRADYAADVVYSNTNSIVYNEGLLIDYRWFDAKNIQPQFPFGFGLSYTTFDYISLVVNSINPPRFISTNGKITESAVLQVSAKITNSGKVDGEEVVQLYLQFPPAANQPPKILRGFDKVFVSSGQSALANFELTDLEISSYDEAQSKWRIYPGSYQILIGSSSRSLKLNGFFQIADNGTLAYSTTGTGIATTLTTTSTTTSSSGKVSNGAEGIVKTNVFVVALFLVLQIVVITMFA